VDLTEALDAEFRDLDIRVTSLMPWFIDTPILDMGTTEGANVKMADEIREKGQDVYPVSLAAQRAWDAAHGDDIHYMAGKAAQRAKFISRWAPGLIRSQVKKSVPPRD
jgi:NAD(P)-dependent dehydrogenase (short-subunit alcohol dehydrogenase family)